MATFAAALVQIPPHKQVLVGARCGHATTSIIVCIQPQKSFEYPPPETHKHTPEPHDTHLWGPYWSPHIGSYGTIPLKPSYWSPHSGVNRACTAYGATHLWSPHWSLPGCGAAACTQTAPDKRPAYIVNRGKEHIHQAWAAVRAQKRSLPVHGTDPVHVKHKPALDTHQRAVRKDPTISTESLTVSLPAGPHLCACSKSLAHTMCMFKCHGLFEPSRAYRKDIRTHQVENAQPATPAKQQRCTSESVACDPEERQLVLHTELRVRPVADLTQQAHADSSTESHSMRMRCTECELQRQEGEDEAP
eukprot:scaffold278713_cov23-Tisochrysis_lutea.AAC.1